MGPAVETRAPACDTVAVVVAGVSPSSSVCCKDKQSTFKTSHLSQTKLFLMYIKHLEFVYIKKTRSSIENGEKYTAYAFSTKYSIVTTKIVVTLGKI